MPLLAAGDHCHLSSRAFALTLFFLRRAPSTAAAQHAFVDLSRSLWRVGRLERFVGPVGVQDFAVLRGHDEDIRYTSRASGRKKSSFVRLVPPSAFNRSTSALFAGFSRKPRPKWNNAFWTPSLRSSRAVTPCSRPSWRQRSRTHSEPGGVRLREAAAVRDQPERAEVGIEVVAEDAGEVDLDVAGEIVSADCIGSVRRSSVSITTSVAWIFVANSLEATSATTSRPPPRPRWPSWRTCRCKGLSFPARAGRARAARAWRRRHPAGRGKCEARRGPGNRGRGQLAITARSSSFCRVISSSSIMKLVSRMSGVASRMRSRSLCALLARVASEGGADDRATRTA